MLAAPKQAIIPVAAGPQAERWVCTCGQLLGFVAGGFFFTRHKGRQVDACLPARVQCDRCGKKNVRNE